ISRTRLPFGFTFRKFFIGQFYVKCSPDRVDLDDVAVLKQADRTADCRFRPDVADAKAARRPRKPAVSDERDLASHSLAGQSGRGRKHLSHAGTALRPLIADHNDLTLFVGPLLDGVEGIFLTVKAAGRPGKAEIGHAGDFHDRSFWREITLQADHAACDGDR